MEDTTDVQSTTLLCRVSAVRADYKNMKITISLDTFASAENIRQLSLITRADQADKSLEVEFRKVQLEMFPN